MSNIVHLRYVKFEYLDDDGNISSTEIGYLIWDDHAFDSYDMYNSFEELKSEVKKETLAKIIEERHSEFYDAVYNIGVGGIVFNGDYFSTDELGEEE